ncbi:hypothetical protein SAMN04488065_1554 [Haloplanus vescus]|uniref:Uncharacterized protein n=1 Tax=Haloplanus vescus TaxID=555874 RepID=A0A1H3XHP8_9EURY|nr:hypothetical protein [Haloplanus vescus]SDZ98471.1 hypothetical protein SAMN04488065_1554 [Haloplanus vescus]
MRIITYTCPACGTIVAANELEDNRVMKCPGLDCQKVLRFEDFPGEAREYFLENRDQYQI